MVAPGELSLCEVSLDKISALMTFSVFVGGSCRVCEWRWLKDRAELCSRWTWLQMRLSELDSQIQWLGKLQQQILSNKVKK